MRVGPITFEFSLPVQHIDLNGNAFSDECITKMCDVSISNNIVFQVRENNTSNTHPIGIVTSIIRIDDMIKVTGVIQYGGFDVRVLDTDSAHTVTSCKITAMGISI